MKGINFKYSARCFQASLIALVLIVSGCSSGDDAAQTTVTTPINIPPVAVNDASTLDEGMAAAIDLADNDTDTDDGLDLGSITIVAPPANGSVVVNTDGTVNYSHDGSESVSDVFTYSIKDNSGAASNTATVNIAVTPVNDLPVAVNDTSNVVQDGTVTVNLADNDRDADDGLDVATITIVATPANGSIVVKSDGKVDYTHDGTATLSDTFTYTIKDNSGAVSNTATVTLTIDELVSMSGTIFDLSNTGESGVEIEGVYSNPGDPPNPVSTTDVNGDFSIQLLKNDAVYLHASKNNFVTINTARAPLSADVTGVERFMPTETEAQSVIDTALGVATALLVNHAWLMVDIEDAGGNEVSGHTISSTPAPATEVYTNCDGTDSGGTATTGPCVPDRQGTMYIAYFDSPAEASVTVGSETQIAPIRMSEIAVIEFEVAAHVNTPPIAVNDDLSADQGSTTNLNLAVNDSDPDDGVDPASITIDTAPTHGTIFNKFDGTVDYTHDGTATLSDTFIYTIKDNSGAVSNPAIVTITVFGSFTNGQAKYDAACASCHAAGSYDPVGESASDLYDDGEKLVTDLSSIQGMKKVPDITPQELLDLKAFLEDPSIAP